MVHDWNTASPRSAAAQDRWAAEISPVSPSTLPSTTAQYRMMPPPPNGGSNGMNVGVNGTANDLQMGTGMPNEMITAPTTVSEAYLTSLKALLNKNTGNYVVAAFLVGTQNLVSWEGILYDVGSDFITIYQAPRERYIVCDIYSLKFIEFYDTRDKSEKLQQQ